MHTLPRALTPLIRPTALAFGAVLRIRNALYDARILKAHRLGSPTISIGNITTGGTGKTPLVIYTARKIMELGLVPVILTRGYGRRASGTTLIVDPGRQLQHTALQMGDEPALIRRHVPQAWFGVSKDRHAAGGRIDPPPDKTVFLLDDGLQHRRLHRDLDIAVIDATQPLVSNHIFPQGTLREPVSGLHRCGAVVVNGAEKPESTGCRTASEIDTMGLEAETFFCEQIIAGLVPLESWMDGRAPDPANPRVRSAFLVAALGNPSRFRKDVENLGIRIAGSRFYRDHRKLEPPDWETCMRAARGAEAEAVIITEKDAIKIESRPGFPIRVAVQVTRMRNEEAYADLLRRCIERRLKFEGPV
jgi:tetraacyldisaccharide 4'-kinase